MVNLEEYGVYCNQDFRDLIGFKLVDVVSDEFDMNGSIVFEKEETGEKQILRINDVVFDGEYMHIIPFEVADMDDEGTIWTKTHEVSTEDLKILNNMRVYQTGDIFDELNNTIGSSIIYVKDGNDGQSIFRSLHIYRDGKIKMSDEF